MENELMTWILECFIVKLEIQKNVKPIGTDNIKVDFTFINNKLFAIVSLVRGEETKFITHFDTTLFR